MLLLRIIRFCDNMIGHTKTRMRPIFMIVVSDIYKKYGKREVLSGASLEAAPGEIVAIAGRNGCGKTTLLQIMAGALKPDSGRMSAYGKDVFSDRRLFAKSIGYVPQDDPLFGDLSVRDNLKFWSSGVKSPDETVLESFELKDLMDKPVKTLSGGMKRRLSIACAIRRKSPILILDEPTSALDLYYQDSIRKWMREYADRNGTIVMSTHSMEELKMADRIYLLKDGRTLVVNRESFDENEIRKLFLISDR